MTKQDLVEAISTQTGISKRDLAGWIGTHHSILSRYLAGTRSLPLRALQQLLFLHQHLSELPPLPAAGPTTENKKEWQQRAAECIEKKGALQTLLTDMQQRREAAAKSLQLLSVLAADTVMLNAKKERWIAEQRYGAEKALEENGVAAIQKLQVQIELLQQEAAIYTALASGDDFNSLD